MYRQYWEKLNQIKTNSKEKPVFRFRCKICYKIFENHNNAASHVALCLLKKSKYEQTLTLESFGITNEKTTSEKPPEIIENAIDISEEDKCLIRLIADCNIPYTQLMSPAWQEFISMLNKEYSIPKKMV